MKPNILSDDHYPLYYVHVRLKIWLCTPSIFGFLILSAIIVKFYSHVSLPLCEIEQMIMVYETCGHFFYFI